jgi:cell division protein FtsL
MTPSALTPAAKGTTKKKRPNAASRPSASRSTGHPGEVRRPVSPRAPRRVSGPAAGRASSAGVIAVPAPAPTRPSRSARPARPRSSRPAATKAPWRLRTAAYVRRLPDHALLDRIIRGRAWIPLFGVLLAGIVAMQVEVLKLNAGIGRSLERGSALQAQNELLRAGVARLSDEQRIERIAAQMGMRMPAPDQLKFVGGGNGTVQRVLGNIHAPSATSFLAQLPTIGAPAAPQGTSVNTDVGLAATVTATTTSTPASAATSTSSATDTGAGSTSATPPPATGTTTGTADTTGTSGSGSPSSGASVTPAAATTSAGTTGQSGSSSSGGVGATPVGG